MEGREGIINVERNFFSSIEKFRLSLGIKKTEWHGISLWAGFFFSFLFFLFFLFFFFLIFFSYTHTYRPAPLDYLTYASPSLSRLPPPLSLERDYYSRLDGRANGDQPRRKESETEILRAKLSRERERESQDDDEQGHYQRLDWT